MLQVPSSTSKHDEPCRCLIMTDQMCSEDACSVPMMRSKDGVIQFCVLHDPLPTSNARNATTPATTTTNHVATPSITSTTTTTTDDIEDDDNSIVVVEHTKQQQQLKGNGDEEHQFRINQERREQSSKASQLIGQKMLQRWALLNDTCPNDACYAIPLVRHPSNKTMYCVICQQTYQPENTAAAPAPQQQQSSTNNSNKEQQQQPANTSKPSQQQQQEQQQQPTPMVTHSPLDSPALDRSIKRQKKEDTTTTTIAPPPPTTHSAAAARAATEKSMQSLTTKLSLLSDRIDQCGDPKDLIVLCQSLDACVKALGTCATTLDILD